jgi:homocysteine S-methyltransferase
MLHIIWVTYSGDDPNFVLKTGGVTMKEFMITVEVVPPAGHDAGPVLSALESLADLAIDGFSVATNPVAKPRMSALALCSMIQQRTSKPVILHCTTRDHNRLSLQGLLWGAQAMGIETVLVMTGDFVALSDRGSTTTVRDLDVFALVRMASETGLHTGVVCDFAGGPERLERAIKRLERKVEAGAQFTVTQPIYDKAVAETVIERLEPFGIPVIRGILPLRTSRHAEFLHQKVAGIDIPDAVRERMAQAQDSIAEGAANAREMLEVARQSFAGACVMPPFNHYEILCDIL